MNSELHFKTAAKTPQGIAKAWLTHCEQVADPDFLIKRVGDRVSDLFTSSALTEAIIAEGEMDYAWKAATTTSEAAATDLDWVTAHEIIIRLLTRLDRLIEDWTPCIHATPRDAEAHALQYKAFKNARKVIKTLSPLIWDKINEQRQRVEKAREVQA